MGADLIISCLWYRLGEPEERTHPTAKHPDGRPYTYIERPPLLDWEAGQRALRTLVEQALVNDDAGEALLTVLDVKDDLERVRAGGPARAYLDGLVQAKWDEFRDSITQGGRDLTHLPLRDVEAVLTGGMSSGDTPTDTMEVWDGVMAIEGIDAVLDATGFIHERNIGLLPVQEA